jgi:glycosyltransferase involved in cell wall biosynthesis
MQKGNIGKYLILVTNHFPYGLGEAFLESEMPFLTKAFDKVIVLARDVHAKELRDTSAGFIHHRINPQSSTREKLVAAGLYITRATQVLQYLREEIRHLKSQQRKITAAILKTMMHDLTKALITAWHIEKHIRQYQLSGDITLYSYWLTNSALALTFVNAKDATLRRIARGHGGDINEFRTPLKYLSFRYSLARHLDRIFTISESGRAHLLNALPGLEKKITLSRLGTPGQERLPIKTHKGYVIVSCAFMVPVKRIDLLIEGLALLKQHHVHWIHIGSGPLKETLVALAQQRLKGKENITFSFEGNLSHDALIDFYRRQYVDLFVNTSSSEGIPVTIMEAQSFGIPTLASHVGGIPEIVDHTTGRLFPVDAAPALLAALIEEILTLPPAVCQSMREKALENWRLRFNADQNFSTFVAEILKR